MENKIKYFVLYPLMLLIVILVMTYDVKDLISLGVRLPFGEAYWKDSLTNTITTNKSIRLNPGDSLYYGTNSVAVSAGGGDVNSGSNNTLSGNNTFSNGTTFSDSARFTAIVNMDSLRVSGNLYQGTSRRFTAVNVNYNLENGFEWQNLNTYSLMTLDSASGLIIRRKFNSVSDSVASDSKFYFSDTVKTNSRFIASDLARFNDSLVMSSYDIFLPNGKGLNWGELTGQIYSNSGELISRSAIHTNYTLYGNFLNSSDSTNGFLVRRKLEGYADTVTSASKWEFSDVVTFSLSPVFSALVTFANGITVTGTATFNGDMVNTGWKNQGSSQNQYKYSRDTVLKMVLSGSSGIAITDSVTHGITNWRSIVFTQFIVHEDSADVNCIIGLCSNEAASAGLFGSIAWTDSRCARVRLMGGNGNSTNWRGDTCTVYIKYTDYNR